MNRPVRHHFNQGSIVIDADDDQAVVVKHNPCEKPWVLVRYISGGCKGRIMYQMERNLRHANAGLEPRWNRVGSEPLLEDSDSQPKGE